MALEPNVKEIVFNRLPDRQMREKAFLQAFVGQYVLAGTTFTISLKGNSALALSISGQPERELAPKRDTTFELQGLTGASVEFRSDASGAVTEMILYRPGSTVVVKRKPGS